MFTEMFWISFVVMYYYLIMCTNGSYGLVTQPRGGSVHQIREREIQDTRRRHNYDLKTEIPYEIDHLPLSDEFESGNEKGTFLVGQLASYLPAWPKFYMVTLQGSRRSEDGRALQATSYMVSQKNRQIHLLECYGTKSCSANSVAADYIVTDISRLSSILSSDSDPEKTETKNTGTNSKSEDRVGDHSEELEPNKSNQCRPAPCSSKQLMAINMKNEVDCGSFYVCVLGQHFLLQCPQDHEFSEEYGVCLEKKYAGCKLNSACKLVN